MTTTPADPATIRSYLVHVSPGAAADVAIRLRERTGCHANPALNRDVLVVVAETGGRAEAEAFDSALAATTGVQGVALVSGFTGER